MPIIFENSLHFQFQNIPEIVCRMVCLLYVKIGYYIDLSYHCLPSLQALIVGSRINSINICFYLTKTKCQIVKNSINIHSFLFIFAGTWLILKIKCIKETAICSVGNNIVLLYRFQFNIFRQFTLQKWQKIMFLCK